MYLWNTSSLKIFGLNVWSVYEFDIWIYCMTYVGLVLTIQALRDIVVSQSLSVS